jgi:hypothetical protein
MTVQLKYGDKTYGLEAKDEARVREQLTSVAESSNGLGLIDFSIGDNRYTLLAGAGIPVYLIDFGQ